MHKRPFATYYFHGILDKDDEYASTGCCETEDGAKSRTIVKVYLNKYEKAVIYNRNTGVTLLTLIRTKHGVEERWGHRTTDYLRRVK